MFLSWLHRSWKYFWITVLTLFLILIVAGGAFIGFLQTESAKSYLAGQIEQNFNDNYFAILKVGELNGFIPFEIRLNDIRVMYSSTGDSSAADTLIRADQMTANINIWSLLWNKVSINSFSLESPKVKLTTDPEGRYTIYRALTRRGRAGQPVRKDAVIDLANIEIIAPGVTVTDGQIYAEGAFEETRQVQFPDPLRIRDINARMFLELGDTQRLWDIETLSARLEGVDAGNINIFGQVYNDERYLEFNAFTLSAGDSEIRLNGEIDGVNLYRENLGGQLRSAFYNIEVSSDQLRLAEFKQFFDGVPAISEPLEFEMQTNGVIDSLWVDDFSLGIGESYLRINGLFQNLSKRDQLSYRFKVNEVFLTKNDVELFTGPLNEKQSGALENLQLSGRVNGSDDSLNVDLGLASPYGQLSLRGNAHLKRPFKYTASFSGRNINPANFIAGDIDTTSLTFDVTASGLGIDVKDAVMELNASVYNSILDGIKIDDLELTSSLLGGLLEQRYRYRSGRQVLRGSGWIDLGREEPPLSFQGNARNIDLSQYIKYGKVPASRLNFDYNIKLSGLTADRIQGRANIDVKPSVLGGDTLQSHQLYMDLDSPDQDTRNFRLTSSIMDLQLSGKIVPSNIIRHAMHWSGYIEERIREEVLLEEPYATISRAPANLESLILDGSFRAKNLSLIKKYWLDFPTVATDVQFGFNVNADSSRLLFSAKARADSIRYNNLHLAGSNAQLTASFRRGMKLKEFSSIDFETSISHMQTAMLNMDSLILDLAFRKDSLQLVQKVGRFSDNARLNLVLNSSLADSAIHISVDDFFLGNNTYAWQSEATPGLIYNRKNELSFNNFSFKNQDEYLELKGTLSPNRADSLSYIIQDVNLERISELIGGRVRFSGALNGNLLTRSLTHRPSVQGMLNVDRFSIQDRLIGDISFLSTYNPDSQRFDTQIKILTDPAKYPDYLSMNDNIGQDIVLNGYFITPDPDAVQDTLYNFDVNFNKIDMWVLPLIVKIFDSMEGEASGEGYLRGNFEDIDFHADFQTNHVFARPKFLETNYFLNGHVVLDRHDGVLIDSVDVIDTQGGTGLLWGTVDLNDFNPITFLDLSLRLNNLQFLNNDFDPDTPFYGTVAGTGLVQLTGANTDLFLRTTEPIAVNAESQLSIPLIEETELNQNNRFIQFVDSFDVSRRGQLNLVKENGQSSSVDKGRLEEAIDDLTFNERFDLDLQFNAPNNINVDLIFDPVTGEILTAAGTGQLRITMQDEEVRMFGSYNITGGSYQFVSGEIFTRRLELENGGSISWQGDPDNARLDISAVYRARPNISTLNYQDTETGFEESGGQRVPVDLILEINGTVSSVENNYFFRLPNSLDLSSNSTLSFAINEINRDEQGKLLQAASILLTGNFIPSQSYNQATSTLSQNLARSSTVINPLLSNQVISPLLSNQMNALLNSDVSRFDIDFNLNAYNEIDLGIALRLYNDKLIFRREGQITGGNPENSLGDRIGDLNATYRINEGLSVTAFHRQDQTMGNLSNGSRAGDVTPTVDGIGLEAKVQFNTWKDLGKKIRSTFMSIFGIKPEELQIERPLASDD